MILKFRKKLFQNLEIPFQKQKLLFNVLTKTSFLHNSITCNCFAVTSKIIVCVLTLWKYCYFRFEQTDASFPLASPHIASLEQILETLENLITVHYATSEATPDTKVSPSG